MSKLILNARMTEILGSFFEDEEMMSIHIDSINICLSPTATTRRRCSTWCASSTNCRSPIRPSATN